MKNKASFLKSKEQRHRKKLGQLIARKYLPGKLDNLIPHDQLNDLIEISILVHQAIQKQLNSLHLKAVAYLAFNEKVSDTYSLNNIIGHFIVNMLADSHQITDQVNPLFAAIARAAAFDETYKSLKAGAYKLDQHFALVQKFIAENLSTALLKSPELAQKAFELPIFKKLLPSYQIETRPKANFLRRSIVGLVGCLRN